MIGGRIFVHSTKRQQKSDTTVECNQQPAHFIIVLCDRRSTDLCFPDNQSLTAIKSSGPGILA